MDTGIGLYLFKYVLSIFYVLSAFVIGLVFFSRNANDSKDKRLKIIQGKILGVCFWVQGVSLIILVGREF